ncbi:alpha/beta hydrolase [Enhygromyxa salina]|uniref:Carboxylesterase NlhH n=1 Tax=Enhygromyxa salina TaxID=215803 RepID=A0A2S9YR97_9BACT|nr:alpha/beta hydrolase fold domain-containing protein [Enhygromyxa salina]PRQ07624.1 Carboxylesterase NlhH [Enhygromyxa salina]
MKRLLRGGVRALTATPERLLRASFGDPPRSDRGIEQDLHTHVLLSLMRLAKLGELHHLSPAKARHRFQADGAAVDLPPTSLAEQRELEIPGPGGPLPARLYRPHAQAASLPVLLWFHGGGFVIGGLESHASACACLASRIGCVVVAVDYRKSPEHKFPSASDDALASLSWVRAHAAKLGVDPDRVAIGGDSAGANLCAGLCHRLRDADLPQPTVQALLYPMTQCNARFASRTQFGEGALLTTKMIDWFHDHYLRGPEDAANPLVSPLSAARFDGLAPALIRTAGFDPLRDEGAAYADALREAGVSVDYRCHERLIHGFLTMGGASPANKKAIFELGDDLAVALGRS